MIGIISDIHGNHAALLAVLAQLDRMGASEIFCLGDVGGYYSQINECCNALRSRGIFSLMGNHDRCLVAGETCPRSNSANTCLNHQRRVITPDNLNWLTSFPSRSVIHGIQMVHGGWQDPFDEYVTPSTDYFSAIPGSFFASGHTHRPCLWSGIGKTYCNPGSVGQPRDGDSRAAFATWDDFSFSLHRVRYDILQTQREMATAGFEPYYYENLDQGAPIQGRNKKLE
ncbi:MAG: metallophosphoesterase family protein [Candidatus Omnitrophota bacterium]